MTPLRRGRWKLVVLLGAATATLCLSTSCGETAATRRRVRESERLPLPPPTGASSLEHLFTDEERQARAEQLADGAPTDSNTESKRPSLQTSPPETRVAGLVDTGAWLLDVRGKLSRVAEGEPNPERPLITRRPVILRASEEDGALRIEIEIAPSARLQRRDAQVIRGWLTDDPIEEGAKLLRATGRDQQFEYQLVGKLHSPGRFSGTFLAIDPHGERTGMHGIFVLQKREE